MKTLVSWRAIEDTRKHQYWRAALVGLGAGGIALAFLIALSLVDGRRVALLDWLHESYARTGWIAIALITGAIGAFCGWMTTRFAPAAGGSGIPHVKGVLAHAWEMPWKRILPVKFIGGALCIGSGFSLGREGPTVQMGAAVGKLVGDILRVPPKAAPRLIACGAGAGLAAAFHAPLAGFIFAIEELQREFSSLTYSMALIAAVFADIVASSFWGSGNVFDATGFKVLPLTALPACILLGVLAGVSGTIFGKAIMTMQGLFRNHVKIPVWQRAGLIGVLVGLVSWWIPGLSGGGQETVANLLHGNDVALNSFSFLLVIFLGKVMLTVLCYMAGVPGGIFAPMLLMGGLMFGLATSALLPTVVEHPAAFAAIGMAAFFAAVVRAPLTGIVLVLQMTGDWDQLLALLTASMVAYMVSDRLKAEPIYEALLASDLNMTQPEAPAHREPVLLEFLVQDGSQMDDQAIKDLPLPERCLFVTVTRQGQDLLPSGGTTLQRGDHVTAVLSGADPSSSVIRLLALSKA